MLSSKGKDISTLVQDIEDVIVDKGWTLENSKALGENLGSVLNDRLNKELKKTNPLSRSGLRMSSIGQPCQRKLWYENNLSEVEGFSREVKDPSLAFKFLYGDLLEEILIELAIAAGHEVTGLQDTMEISGIKGHRDCVIDGVTVDIKSASSFAFGKFRDHNLVQDDPFGYLAQLNSYVYAAKDDPLVRDKKGGAFLVVDKQHGTLALDYYDFEELNLYDDTPLLYSSRKDMVSKDEPPARSYLPEPDGKSGNKKLQTNCVYCPFNKTCYPSLRVFQGKGYQKHLVEVKREPSHFLKEIKVK